MNARPAIVHHCDWEPAPIALKGLLPDSLSGHDLACGRADVSGAHEFMDFARLDAKSMLNAALGLRQRDSP